MSSIIDNSPNNRLVSQVNTLLNSSKFSSMAVGYFYLSGFEAIREKLHKVQNLRLIIGNRSNQETVEELVKGHAAPDAVGNELRRQMLQNNEKKKALLKGTKLAYANDLTYMLQDHTNENGLRALWQLIAEKRIDVRVYTKGFLHSKVYIFEDPENTYATEGAAIVGSSNLSVGGMSQNTELNVKINNENDVRELKKWFDDLWENSEPFSADLMDAMQNSWVQKQVTPYEIYIKTLYHLVKDRINIKEYFEIGRLGFDYEKLFPFQRDAFNMAIAKLENPVSNQNGVFIADVVGLGKSYIALAIIGYYWSVKRKNTLVICPASLKNMWEEYREVFKLNCHIMSSSELAYKDGNTDYTLNDEPKYNGYEVVVIDEAHNFRNPDTQKYRILAPWLQDKKVLMLTATPQNKSVWDVYHQIKLFHQSDISNLNISPNNLKTYFKENEENPEKIAELLQNFVIRRTRNDISNSPKYKNIGLKFPKRKLITVDYEIDATYTADGRASIYETILERLFKAEHHNRYAYSIYDLTGFLKPANRKLKTYQGLSYFGEMCRGLLKTLLFKRLESSVTAFYESLGRMIKRHEYVLQGIALRGTVITGKVELIELFLDFEGSDVFGQRGLNEYPADDFDIDALTLAIETDIAILTEVRNSIKHIIANDVLDKKYERFLELVLKPNRAQKMLIFSEFSETVKYLYQRSRREFPNITCAMVASSVTSDEKADIIRRFAPKAQTLAGLADHEKEISLLFTTDVLSEGQNLQDAHIIVNYDFHWNPVRLIQRIGRIDRIGSTADEIQIYNFMPDVNIERQLDLRGRVQSRIDQIHRIFGSDSEILSHDEDLNENSLFAIYSDHNEGILDTDNNISTVFDQAEKTLLELKHAQPDEYERIINLEDGIRTAAAGGKGTFAFLSSGNLHRLYYADQNGISDHLPLVLKKIEASPQTPAIALNAPAHTESMKQLYAKFKNELLLRQRELTGNQITPEQRQFIEQLKNIYNLFSYSDFELSQRIDRLVQMLTKEIPHYAANNLRKLKRDKLSESQLIEALETFAEVNNIAEFQKRLLQSEKMMIRTVCSERFE